MILDLSLDDVAQLALTSSSETVLPNVYNHVDKLMSKSMDTIPLTQSTLSKYRPE